MAGSDVPAVAAGAGISGSGRGNSWSRRLGNPEAAHHPSPAIRTPTAAALPHHRVLGGWVVAWQRRHGGCQPQRRGVIDGSLRHRGGTDIESLQRVERLDLHVELFDERHGQRSQVREIAAGHNAVDGDPVLLAHDRHAVLDLRREVRDQGVALEQLIVEAGDGMVSPLDAAGVQDLSAPRDDDGRAVPGEGEPGSRGSRLRPRTLRRQHGQRLFRRNERIDDEPALLE